MWGNKTEYFRLMKDDIVYFIKTVKGDSEYFIWCGLH